MPVGSKPKSAGRMRSREPGKTRISQGSSPARSRYRLSSTCPRRTESRSGGEGRLAFEFMNRMIQPRTVCSASAAAVKTIPKSFWMHTNWKPWAIRCLAAAALGV